MVYKAFHRDLVRLALPAHALFTGLSVMQPLWRACLHPLSAALAVIF